MITVRHCLLPALFCLPLALSVALADSWTVYPTTQTNTTGYTDYAAKHDGPILIYGGATTGTLRKGNGYLKFDLSSIPDSTTVSAVEWHFYVNAANYPYWSVTPLSLDPVPISSTAALLWEDTQAEALSGYYNYQNEGSMYDPGWKTLVLGGTANTDLTAALGQDWFSFGAVSRDNTATYYLEIDGHTDANVPYLVVHDNPPPPNDTCAGAIIVPGTPGSSSHTGDTTFAIGDYDCSAACVGGMAHGGPDLTYSITLPAGCEICVTLNQGEMSWNGAVYMVTDCADVNGSCVAGASGWLPGGGDETFCYSDTATETYYIIVDGRSGGGSGPFQLDVDISCLQAPGDLQCIESPWDIDLTWSNNDTYDNIEIHIDGDLETTLPGTATSATVVPHSYGYTCIQVCGLSGSESNCADPCCLVFGYNEIEVLWDFEADDGGFVVEGTGGWEWGSPTHGPCSGTADGNVWATGLHTDYPLDACWILDTPVFSCGYVYFAVDHCYDIENGFDGGVVWFTTDDQWYYNLEPIDGTDGVISGFDPLCPWVEGHGGFTGSSGGWVTDVWDFTGALWQDESLKARLAFASDSSVTASGWMIDNVTVYWHHTPHGIDCDYTITPTTGTVPFPTTHRISLYNLQTGGAVWTRRIAARIAVTIGNGTWFNPWRAGYTNVAPASVFAVQFPLTIPALATLIGNNTFSLTALDVTPAPYNQPPYMPAGSTCTRTTIVVANAP